MTSATQNAETVAIHPWDRAVGHAPYALLSVISMPGKAVAEQNVNGYNNAMRDASQQAQAFGVQLGSCDICGTGIQNHFVIENAIGGRFVVGCDCVQKIDDAKLVTAVEAATRERKQAQAEARRKAFWEAAEKARAEKTQSERDTNGGMTVYEIRMVFWFDN